MKYNAVPHSLYTVPNSPYASFVDASDRLIRSMQALLWERGYGGTSPKAVQQRARAGQGSMYHHFEGKAHLALVALQRSAEQLKTQAGIVLFGPGTAHDRIAFYLRRERDVLRGCRFGRLAQDPELLAEPALTEIVNETLSWLQDKIADVVTAGQKKGEISPDLDARLLAGTILSVLQGGYVLAKASGSSEPFDRAVDGLLALLRATRH